MKAIKVPTYTTLVLEMLRERDDFMNRKMLIASIKDMNRDQLSAALISLRNYRAIDVIVEPDGEGWWYALPPEDDTRLRHFDERTPETQPRRPRRKKGEKK